MRVLLFLLLHFHIGSLPLDPYDLIFQATEVTLSLIVEVQRLFSRHFLNKNQPQLFIISCSSSFVHHQIVGSSFGLHF